MGPAVSAPLDLGAAADRRWDAVVVGAGPAGSIAAYELARRGRAVLLLERARLPRYKVCGGCLNERALAVLRAEGLDRCVWQQGAKSLRGITLASGKRRADVPLPGGAALSRTRLDAALAAAAREAGAGYLEGCPAGVERVGERSVALRLRQGDSSVVIEAGACIVASGLAGDAIQKLAEIRVEIDSAARIGAGAHFDSIDPFYQPGQIYMAVAPRGYVGLVRVEDDALNVAASFDVRHVREWGSPQVAAARILEEAGLPAPAGLAEAAWRGTPPLTRRARPAAVQRVVLVGDAAGYIEPFTGEGMAWALESGRAAAALVHDSLEGWNNATTAAWERIYSRRFAVSQRRCRAIAAMLRRPTVVGAAVYALRAAPSLARPLVRSLNAPSRAEEFAP
jgi:flavin-dependent dehydrogenase